MEDSTTVATNGEREEKRRKWWLKQMKKRSKEGMGDKPSREEIKKKEEEKEEEVFKDTNRKQRYLLFIGNLPYTVTSDDINDHFTKRGVQIQQVRLLTVKGTEQSRGCGFLEFNSLKHQQNALKFHRTKLLGRTINLEVTCGGGGNGENRKTKLKRRNEKLTRSREQKNNS